MGTDTTIAAVAATSTNAGQQTTVAAAATVAGPGTAVAHSIATMGTGAAVAHSSATIGTGAAVAATSPMASHQAPMATSGTTVASSTITNHATAAMATMTGDRLALATHQSQTHDREEHRDPEQYDTIHLSPPQNSVQMSQEHVADLSSANVDPPSHATHPPRDNSPSTMGRPLFPA
jgi:hypothetical protein